MPLLFGDLAGTSPIRLVTAWCGRGLKRPKGRSGRLAITAGWVFAVGLACYALACGTPTHI